MKTIRFTPCYDCGCEEYSVTEYADGYVKINCLSCQRCLTEGYSSPEQLVKKKRLRNYCDENILFYLDSWEKSLEEARTKGDAKEIMFHQEQVNDFQGELFRRNLTDRYTTRKQEISQIKIK